MFRSIYVKPVIMGTIIPPTVVWASKGSWPQRIVTLAPSSAWVSVLILAQRAARMMVFPALGSAGKVILQ